MDIKPSAIIIANHYGPESLALAAAAHSIGIKVVITNHAISANERALGVPVHADFLVCSGDAIKDVLQSEAADVIDYCYLPLDIPSKEMSLPEIGCKSVDVGIYLTALTDMEELEVLVSQLYSVGWCNQIRVRQHPAKIVNSDCEILCNKYPGLILSEHVSLQEDIGKCDIAICGNSTVVVEILRGGKPVTYISTLDFLPNDYARFVFRGLLPVSTTDKVEYILDDLHRHYKNEFWVKKMRYFDACYLKEEQPLNEEFKTMMSSIGTNKKSDTSTVPDYFKKTE